MEIWYCYHSIITRQKQGRSLFAEEAMELEKMQLLLSNF